MAILADYVIPPDKTPEDLAKDLEAMVSGVNTLSLQATTGTAVVVSPCTDSGTYIVDPSIGIFGRSCNGGLGTSLSMSLLRSMPLPRPSTLRRRFGRLSICPKSALHGEADDPPRGGIQAALHVRQLFHKLGPPQVAEVSSLWFYGGEGSNGTALSLGDSGWRHMNYDL